MLIVAGYLRVVEAERDGFVNDSRAVVEQARRADGCLDFALSADLVEPDRVLVFERWDDRAAVEAFRGAGPGDEQLEVIEEFEVNEYDVVTSAPPQESAGRTGGHSGPRHVRGGELVLVTPRQ